jgi:succinate dehydrogenase (ubiquinone) flavoprotein subunit
LRHLFNQTTFKKSLLRNSNPYFFDYDNAQKRRTRNKSFSNAESVRRHDVNWMKHTVAYFDAEDGKTDIKYRPNHHYTLDEEECAVVAPVARVY